MVLLTSRRSLVLPHAVRFALLAVGGLLLGHEAAYAVQYGVGAGFTQAMAEGGHGYWPMFSTLALSALLLLLGRAAWRLAQLHVARVGERQETARPASIDQWSATAPRSYRRELIGLWPPLFGVVAVAYAIQENVEHFTSHGHVPGLEPLIGTTAPFALPVLALVTLGLAAVGALLRWRIATLEAHLAQARARHPPRSHAGQRPAPDWAVLGAVRATFWSLIRQGPERAPPRSRST